MTFRILRSADHRRVPWKNGGGEAVEVAIFPDGSGLSDFGWRVSVATVASDGAFSIFPGVDRTLAILSGEGVELDIDSMGSHTLRATSAPLAFPADVPVNCRLLNGSITDLNVMTRRGVFRHRLTLGSLGPRSRLDSNRSWRIVMALGDMALHVDERPVVLDRLDVLLCDGDDTSIVLGKRRTFFSVEIDEV